MKRPGWLKWLDDWWEQSTAPTPLEDSITDDMRKTALEILQIEYTIKQQRFLKHMAEHKQQAMVDWIAQEKQK